MCGRFSIDIEYNDMKNIIQSRYQIEQLNLDYNLPRYNVSPGQKVIAVIHDGTQYRAGTLKWGFVPHWAKDEKIGYSMINAKSESVDTKPAFRQSFKSKRCVILADGFYEWRKEGKEKIPFRFQTHDQKIFPLAGLWSTYIQEDGNKLHTCTIITTTPNETVSSVHDRMPVILTPDHESIWLNPKVNDINLLKSILIPYESNQMSSYQVSTIVNNAKNETPECVIPINT